MFEARNEPRASGPLWPIVGCVLLLLVLSVDAVANDDDETLEADRWRPGLVASLIGAKGHAQHRIDTNVAFNWQAQRPDPRIDSHDFRGLWQGRLFSIVPGPYRLYVYAQGTVTVELNGAAVLNASAEKPGWLTTAPIELEYGYHPLRIAYRRTTAEGRLALYWSGPQFQLEPVPVWHLFHDVDESPNDRFAEGEALVRALRCNACHAIPSLVPPLPAPSLTKLGGHVDEPWLIEWLQSAGHTTTTTGESVESSSVPRRMPAFDLNRDEATALVAWLLTTSDRESSPTHDLQTGDAQAGESLFHTVGCLACHQVNGAGTGGLFGGGDLSRIAENARRFLCPMADRSCRDERVAPHAHLCSRRTGTPRSFGLPGDLA